MIRFCDKNEEKISVTSNSSKIFLLFISSFIVHANTKLVSRFSLKIFS